MLASESICKFVLQFCLESPTACIIPYICPVIDTWVLEKIVIISIKSNAIFNILSHELVRYTVCNWWRRHKCENRPIQLYFCKYCMLPACKTSYLVVRQILCSIIFAVQHIRLQRTAFFVICMHSISTCIKIITISKIFQWLNPVTL